MRKASDSKIGEIVVDAVRRYDAAMPGVLPASPNDEVERYLTTPLRAYLSASGKRLRPLLCELGCELVGGERETVTALGCAIESFHTAALIHDDIEDGGTTRRGLPAYHIAEGTPGGINAGDYGLALAFGQVLACPDLAPDLRIRIMGEFVETAKRTIEGQAVDLGWTRDGTLDMTVGDCLFVAEAKTAYYTCAAPLAVGALAGGGTEEEAETLRQVGTWAGIAFQLKDDLLNLEAGASGGKDSLSDLYEGKRTAIIAHGLTHSPRADELHGMLTKGVSTEAEAQDVLALLREAGSLAYVEHLSADYCARAKDRLLEAFPESSARNTLVALIDYIHTRMR